MSQTLSDAQRLEWLRLIRSDGVGPRTFRALVQQYGGAGAALDALPALAGRAGRREIRVASRTEALREMEALARIGGRFLAQGELDYPAPLLAIDSSPPLIALRGSAEAIARPCVAVVGSRNASAAGATFAERLSAELGRAGYVVVSGLARGIDARAHRASLATGSVAVLAGGHERVYPDENRPLLERILEEGGAAISEMPLGWAPRSRDFPRRNRLVSGLSYGVVVVEAARRSGSLITARFALEQGREVFAVPGSPLDPRAEGANELIRGGATLCASVDHVTAVLEPLLGRRPSAGGGCREPSAEFYGRGTLWDELDLAGVLPAPSAGDGSEEEGGAAPEPTDDGERLLSLVGVSPVSIDDLARQAGLSARTAQSVLVELELAGAVERHGGNLVSLAVSRLRG